MFVSPPISSGASEGESDTDSEAENRVDGVKSWLSKSKGYSKNLSDDGSLKSSRSVLNAERVRLRRCRPVGRSVPLSLHHQKEKQSNGRAFSDGR